MDLIDEENGAKAVVLTVALRFLDGGPHVLHPGEDGVEREKLALCRVGDDTGEGGLPGPRRARENNRREHVGLDGAPEEAALAEYVVLSDELVNASRSHPRSQRLLGFVGLEEVLLLAHAAATSAYRFSAGPRAFSRRRFSASAFSSCCFSSSRCFCRSAMSCSCRLICCSIFGIDSVTSSSSKAALSRRRRSRSVFCASSAVFSSSTAVRTSSGRSGSPSIPEAAFSPISRSIARSSFSAVSLAFLRRRSAPTLPVSSASS